MAISQIPALKCPKVFLQDKLRHWRLVKMHFDLSNLTLDLQSLKHIVVYCDLPRLKPLTDLQITKTKKNPN